ncbi:MAG TPA: ASKHA domain-containing protein [Vicinamibacterales bacterium]|nr:ASKHA domain-containing protein [Vicinamibacterales bacterium]
MREIFIDHRRTVDVPGGSLFDCAESIGLQVPTSCIKQGKCRECILEIEEGAELLSARTRQEAHLGERFRLACRTHAEKDGTIRCHTMRRGALRIVDEARELPPLLRRHDPPVADGWGIAVDLGTTTVALRLFDLSTGEPVGSQSFENPQRFGGSDIMARIRYDTDHRGRLLQRTLLGYLRQAIHRFPVPPESVRYLTVAANTTMRDLLFGLDVHSIGQKPYCSLTEHELRQGLRETTSLMKLAKRLRLEVHPEAQVYGLPIIGSHVGADAAAGLLATGIAEQGEISVLMDVGTNTEIIMGNRDRLVAASCPAGPAFEGGGVLCGMPALEGAIERVAIRDDGDVMIEVIGGGAPGGICGSGLVDLLSELVRTGRMNAQGRFADGLESFHVHPADSAERDLQSPSREPVVFTERDVNELAQAKGANVAGLRILQDVFGIGFDRIDRFYLAGAFALHLDPAAARRIGLIPDLPDEKIVRVGNAALEGAAAVLLSETARRELETLVRRVEHIELETHPRFFDFFVEGCQFVPIGSEVIH